MQDIYRRESQFHFKGLIISQVRSRDFSNQYDVTIRGEGGSCRKALESDVVIAGRRYCRGGATAWPALRRSPSSARPPKTVCPSLCGRSPRLTGATKQWSSSRSFVKRGSSASDATGGHSLRR